MVEIFGDGVAVVLNPNDEAWKEFLAEKWRGLVRTF